MQSQKQQNDLSSFPGQTIQHHSNPSLCPKHWCWTSQKWLVLWRPTRPSRTITKKDVLFIIGDWNAKVESQDVLRVTGKFGLEVQNEAEQRLTVFPREHTGHSKHTLPKTREDSTHGHHQMVNTEIRLIMFFAAKDGEALYSQQKKTRNWLWLRSWTPYCQI